MTTPFSDQNWGPCSPSQPAHPRSSKKELCFDDICRKIAYLLGKDYKDSINSGDLMELAKLAKLLQADEALDSDQVTLLEVIGEIPTMVNNHDELAKLRNKIKCLSSKVKKDMANCFDMKKNYSRIIGTMKKVQTELDGETSAIRDIDEQIAMLRRRRSEIFTSAKGKRNKLVQMETARKEVRKVLTNIIDQVKVGKKETQESEMSKNVLAENNAVILARLAKYKNVPFPLFPSSWC